MTSDRVLYWGSGSPQCWTVRIALSEKGLEYDSKLMEFSKMQHKSPKVLAVNPRGQLPAFKDGDVVVNESLAAIIYLEETYSSGTQLLPKDPKARAQVWQRTMELQVLNEQLKQLSLLRAHAPPRPSEEHEAQCNQLVDAVRTELGLWEGYLASSKFLAGETFSLADAVMAPIVLTMTMRWAGNLGERFPRLAAYTDLLRSRPSSAGSTPPHWEETPSKDWLAGL